MLTTLLVFALLAGPQTPVRPPTPAPARPQAPRTQPPRAEAPPPAFTTPYALDEMRRKQAVISTSKGDIVVDLLPDAAPNHVGLFMKLARDGAYDGTAFHRVILNAIIQGGDPISRDAARTADYGTGGFNQLKAEASALKHSPGALSTVKLPGLPDSGGAQFFISITDQPGLDGEYTVFGRVYDGLEVAEEISQAEANADGLPTTRLEIKTVTIRDTPPEPYVNDLPAALGAYHAVFETTMGTIEMELYPDRAPNTVRQFLRLIDAGIYDGVLIHRIVENFVIQTGAMAYRDKPLTIRQQRLIRDLDAEFSSTPNLPGFVSMARGDNPNSANTSFFICTGACRALDGNYTVFGRVVSDMDVITAIALLPTNSDETPRTKVVVTKAMVRKP